MVSAQVQVIVGGGGSQRGRTPSRLLAKDAVELGVAAEAGLERGGQRLRALPFAVETQKTLQSLLVAEPADPNAGLLLEYPAQVRRAQVRRPREHNEITRVRVGLQHPSDRLHRRMQIDAFDDVVAVEKRSPGEAQQIRQPGVDKKVVYRLRRIRTHSTCAPARWRRRRSTCTCGLEGTARRGWLLTSESYPGISQADNCTCSCAIRAGQISAAHRSGREHY